MDRAAFDQKQRMGLPDLQRSEATVRSIAGGFGMTLRIHNIGQHWEFKREGLLVDWWPGTGSLMVNKNGGRKTRVFTIEELRKVLAQDAAKAPAKPQQHRKGSIPSSAELTPNRSRKCDNCDNLGAIPFSGMCGPCTYGTAEALDW